MVNTTFISTMRRVALAGVALLVASATSVSAQDKISVDIDQAAPVKLSRPAATVVVGNPSIADIAAFDAGYFFVTGRTMGTTNVVAVDGKGETIANVLVTVRPPSTDRVVLHRNIQRYSYSCAPNCERVAMPGDMVSDSNPIPVYPEMDQSNKTKLEAGLEGKKATEDSN